MSITPYIGVIASSRRHAAGWYVHERWWDHESPWGTGPYQLVEEFPDPFSDDASSLPVYALTKDGGSHANQFAFAWLRFDELSGSGSVSISVDWNADAGGYHSIYIYLYDSGGSIKQSFGSGNKGVGSHTTSAGPWTMAAGDYVRFQVKCDPHTLGPATVTVTDITVTET